ncbi:MAG: hypothetical protein M0035_16350 [Actinomycetota bacterium]|jgi:hypothetical protein|nr:hypothetical protein [Actinomycetota bacterium]
MTLAAVDLWAPGHIAGIAVLVTAFLLGIVHGITPDEHTWPITFSYAIGGYSTKKGMRAGLVFSFFFTLQRALASELAYLGLARVLTTGSVDYALYVVVGALMALGGVMIVKRRRTLHLHLPGLQRYADRSMHTAAEPSGSAPGWLDDPRPWMPAVHGFVAGWGFGAFAVIIYTVLAPAMHSAALGWVPGALFGLGTTVVQVLAGALFGKVASRRGLSQEGIRRVALLTAGRTLKWGGFAFVVGGLFGLAFPNLAGSSIGTGLHVHNLAHFGLPLVLVLFAVLGVGITTLVRETRSLSASEHPAPEHPAPEHAAL